MVWNDVLNYSIPAEWSECDLNYYIGRITNGLNPRKNFVLGSGNNYYVTIRSLVGTDIDWNNCDRCDNEALKKINSRSQLQIGDVIFSAIGTIGRTYFIQEDPSDWNISETSFTLRARGNVSPYFFYALLRSEGIQKNADKKAMGSTLRCLVMDSFCKIPTIKVSDKIIAKFAERVKPIYQKIYGINKENRLLIKQRNELLPLLMNGQVTVNPDLSVFTENVILEFFAYICGAKPNIFNNMTKQETNKHTSEENQKELEKNCTENPQNFLNLKNIAICAGVILGILIIYYLSVYGCIGINTDANGGSDLSMGTFGDTFGAANALFSGLAFAGMIIALHQQKEELRMQREVLNLQRDDLKLQIQTLANTNAALDGQKEEMAEQLKAMKKQLEQGQKQRFESNLFNMLGQYDNIVNGIHGYAHEPEKGRDYMAFYADMIKIDKSFETSKIQFSMANYINYLFQMFKLIDEAAALCEAKEDFKIIEYHQRKLYCSIVTSYISFNEMLLLQHYIYIVNKGYYQSFIELVEKYALLENIRLSGAYGRLLEIGRNFAYDSKLAEDKFKEDNGIKKF